MTNKEFNIWLATNGHTKKSIATKLKITEATLQNYKRNEFYPVQFQYALKGVVSETHN